MIQRGIHAFRGKGVLLLQGPVGPFFSRLANDLEVAGATVFKVNFNVGDSLFYRRPAFAFKGAMSDWPAWLDALLEQLNVDVVLLFGDCRPIHAAARRVAAKRGLEVGVFEEGYLRPHFMTFERHGVNGNSQVPRSPEFYLNQPEASRPQRTDLGNTYWHMALWAFLYFLIGSLGKPWYPHYVHHRTLSLTEAWPWIRSGWRKIKYRALQHGVLQRLCTRWDKKFFLVPLQVFNDAQVFVHSSFDSVEEFVEDVVASFAQHAPAETALVIKHHPMSRGYTDYAALIKRLASEHGIADRCLYIHDQHLPTLLRHARGVVVINSTTGLQALNHNVPVKTMGDAIFNMPGLCHQGTLDAFWRQAPLCGPDKILLNRFVDYLVSRSQLNGSFYRRTPTLPSRRTASTWHATDWGALSAVSGMEQSKDLAVARFISTRKRPPPPPWPAL